MCTQVKNTAEASVNSHIPSCTSYFTFLLALMVVEEQ